MRCSYIRDDSKGYDKVARTSLQTSHIRIRTDHYIQCSKRFSSIQTAFWFKNSADPEIVVILCVTSTHSLQKHMTKSCSGFSKAFKLIYYY